MNEPLTQLHAEAMTAEREWTVEEIPVLPPPSPCRNQFQQRTKSPAASGGITSSSAAPSYAIVRRTPRLRRRRNTALLWAASLPLPHLRAELTYQVTYNDGGLWSLYTQSRESGFSGRPTLLRHGDTWDLTSGYPVPLSAFFPAAADGSGG